MIAWDSLTFTQQTLLDVAFRRGDVASTIHFLGQWRRWSGIVDAAALRNYTEAEVRALVPEVSAAAVELLDRGLLLVRDQRGLWLPKVGPVLEREAAHALLADTESWVWSNAAAQKYAFDVPDGDRERWERYVWPPVGADRMPPWDELSEAEQEIVICAYELSGYLTGAFGIWSDPPADLGEADRCAWVAEQLAPLLPYVRKGWIEVRHVHDEVDFDYTVIPYDRLLDAFSDLEMRYQGNEWGVGFTCVLTRAGDTARRAGWAKARAGRPSAS